MLLALLALLALAMAAKVPEPPRTVAHLDAYMDRHGDALLTASTMAGLGTVHPGGAAAASETTVRELVKLQAEHLKRRTPEERLRRVADMYAKLP